MACTLNEFSAATRPGPILAYGELLLRLSAPRHERLLQTPQLHVHVGGAEANVTVALSSLGHATQYLTVLPDTSLGRAALAEVRKYGIDCSQARYAAGRMGLYFYESGSGHRNSSVLYDRAGSAFTEAALELFDWASVLHGASLLHVSGVTPALGMNAIMALRRALEAAVALGIPISFDGNFRESLWARWSMDPAPLLLELMGMASILFANHRDIGLVLGTTFPTDAVTRRRASAEAAFKAFARLQLLASTDRNAETQECHHISAHVVTRDAEASSAAVMVSGIVDRIGTGDAFAAGVIHALRNSAPLAEVANSGLALACLKHTLPGDFCTIRLDELARFGQSSVDVRR